MQDSILEKQTVRKVSLRLIPFLMLLLVLNFMDRVNLGFAALHMNRDLGFSAVVYGLGAGVFFLGYMLFEIPSNVAMHRYGARRWICRIVFTWGLLACANALIRGPVSFYLLRFLLGVAEAGFYPGVIYYLSEWFPERSRAKAFGWFQVGQAVGVIIAGPISAMVLQLDGVAGISGWQWLFVAEGIPSVIAGMACLFVLSDSPAAASWLSTAQKAWLSRELTREHAAKPPGSSGLAALLRPQVLLFAVTYFCLVLGFVGTTLWLPQIIHAMGVHNDLTIGFLAAAPYVCGAVAQIINSAHSDRTGERKLHVGLPMIVGSAGFAVSALAGSQITAFISICIAMTGILMAFPLFWTLPITLLSGLSAAAGLAFINSFANIGGFLGPFLMGWTRQITGHFMDGLLLQAVVLCIGSLIVLTRKRGRPQVASTEIEVA